MSIGSTLLNLQGAQQPQQGGQMGQPPQQPQNLQSPDDMKAANQRLAQGPQSQGGQYPPSSSGLNIDWSNPNAAAQFAMDMDNRAYQRDMFNRGITNIAASFAPVRDREAMYQQAGLTGPSGSSMLKDIVEIQNQGETLRQRAAQQAAIPAAGKLLLPGSDPDQAKSILSALSSEDFNTAIRQQLHSMEPTDAVKQFDQMRQRMKADGMTDEQIKLASPPEMLGLANITDPVYREYKMGQLSGNPAYQMDYNTFLQQKAAQTKRAEQITTAHTTAREDYPAIVQPMEENLRNLEYLRQHPDDFTSALRDNPVFTEGQTGKLLSYVPKVGDSQGVLDAKRIWNQVLSNASSQALIGTHNVRTQREFNTYKDAATALNSATIDRSGVDDALASLTTKTKAAYANAKGAAGEPIPYELKGYVDPGYLDPSDKERYNGSVAEVAPGPAMAYLRQHPETRDQFDKTFGDQNDAKPSAKVLGQ